MPFALTVEDGTGVAGANTYCAIATADAYHDGILRAEKWQQADSDTKQRALAQATRLLDQYIAWQGTPVVLTRETPAWPRYGAYDRNGIEIASSVVPTAVVEATAELARRLIEDDRLRKAEDPPVSLSAHGRAKAWASRSTPVIPDSILRALASLAAPPSRLLRVG